MRRLLKPLLIACGTLCVVLAILGMLLPVLPTTPFLLLAAFCYARSSARFYRWLLTNRWFGRYIRAYRAGLGIPLRQKVISITLLWLTIGYSVTAVIGLWWVRALLLAIAVGVTIHLVTIHTHRPELEPLPPLRECGWIEECS